MSLSGGISTLAVKQVKTVKRADYSIQKFGNKKTGRMCLNRLRTYDGRNLYGVSGECIAALRAERSARNKLTLLTSGQRMNMEFKEYDFARNPRSVPPVAFRFWCAQLRNWSNTKDCAELNVARQMPLRREEA